MNVQKQACLGCSSENTIVIDVDELGFDYDLYRKCLNCGETQDIDSSETI